MKSRIISLLIVIMLLPIASFASNEAITVEINSVPVAFDVQPQIINSRTMVPMRKIFEELGAVVTWDGPTQTATGKKGDVTINFTINSNILFKNGTPILLDTAPVIVDGRTLVPVRAIAESFNCNVDWNDATRTVEIISDAVTERPILSAEEISQKDASAVFYIEVYDENDDMVASGSGFFISEDGTAVTNYHVIEGTSSAYMMTTENRIFEITNVLKYDEELDIAVVKVSKTDIEGKSTAAFPFLKMGNSNNLKAGQVVYAIGSPQGLQNSISDGIISNPKQVVGSQIYIQTTAAISHGSSGGALVDQYGDVIGITSAGIDEGENLGFAIPINAINSINKNNDSVSYKDFAQLTQATSDFELEISDEELTIECGKSSALYVYAAGANEQDWSIYWGSSNEAVAACEWGDWMDDYPDICPLYIYGEKAGETYIKISSDINVEPKYCKVTVVEPKLDMEYYPGTGVPTYTAFSGIKPIEVYEGVYSYPPDESLTEYVEWLLDMGYEFVGDKREEDYGVSYSLMDQHNNYVGITIAVKYEEIWIYPQ